MAHVSIMMETPCEFINIVPMNPLISKCQIKVCYVGQTPNRNKSVITKEVAAQMANSLPGSPIVGFYNKETGDFEEHNKEIYFEDGKIKLKDTTRPYGFVDIGAKCWFQKFLDDGVEHEYLMTEGYIWTGQYPESKRIIEKGNNQSMELDEDYTKAFWTNSNNSKGKFFIINESIFSKLCILGEEYEPCFEGASISKVQFSFNEEFNQKMYSMMEEVSKYINKGGETMPNTNEVLEVNVQSEETPVVEEAAADAGAIEFKKKDEEKKEDTEGEDAEKDAEKSADNSEASGSESKKEDKAEDESSDDEEKDEDEKKKEGKKVKYVLDEIPEYVELSNNYAILESERDTLNETIANLIKENNELKNFKLKVEKKDKEAMINSFYMLSDAEKADVIENIDKYSVEDIEAKLSVICVRNKINFNLDENEKEENSLTFNLDATDVEETSIPAWVKEVLKNQKNKI